MIWKCKSWPLHQFKTDNYAFYQQPNESIESNEKIKNVAVNIYYTFTNTLMKLLTKDEYLYIREHGFKAIPLPESELPTNIKLNNYVDIIVNFNVFNLNKKENLRFMFVDEKDLNNSKAGYIIGKNIIVIACKHKKDNIILESIVNIYTIPDIIIHEIIHFINDIRANNKGFDHSQNTYKQYYNDPREIHTFTQNLQHLLNDLLLNGYEFKVENIETKEKLLELLKNVSKTDYKYITSNEVLNQLYVFVEYLTPKNFRRVLQDIVEYYVK